MAGAGGYSERAADSDADGVGRPVAVGQYGAVVDEADDAVLELSGGADSQPQVVPVGVIGFDADGVAAGIAGETGADDL